jgi:alpha-tubulin suppressor-like RCC1 family protein
MYVRVISHHPNDGLVRMTANGNQQHGSPRGACLFLALFSILAACSAADDPPTAAPNPSQGTISSQDGKASVELPPGALSGDPVVTVEVVAGSPGNLGTAYEVAPALAHLNLPVTISIKYDEADIPSGISETNLRLALLVKDEWHEIDDSFVDTMDNVVRGTTTSLGTFGIIAFSLSIQTVTLAAGGSHTCAITLEERVRCWGGNSSSQLGNGNTMDSTIPVEVEGLTEVASIAAGDTHTIALKKDGTVWAWGSNLRGQLGDDTIDDRSKPVQVIGMKETIAIAAGGTGVQAHTLALDRKGMVWAWGDNFYGQVGDGTLSDRHVPIKIVSISDVKGIAAGARHTIAVTKDGRVWTWGRNLRGQLGDGTTSDQRTPVPIQGVTDVVAIAGGAVDTLAVTSDGTVWAWGDYFEGLDPIFNNGTLLPKQVVGLPEVQRVAAGVFYDLALTADGTVWGWGANGSGELGDGTTIARDAPVLVPGLNDVVAIAAGRGHSSAVQHDGSVWAWGANDVGQLGDGSTIPRSTPGRVSD